MKVLVLGGTSFVGRAIVDDLLRSGAAVTLFNRGTTPLFPAVPRLTGDRDTGDYSALTGSWDAVVDVSGYVPRHVAQSMSALGDRVHRYLFISTVAVYAPAKPWSDEDTPRRDPIRDTEILTNETYGPCKVACEDDVLTRYGTRATIVRPGKVAGPHDPQPGLVDWLRATMHGGRVEIPTDPSQPVQLIDSRDLARLVAQLLTDDRPGAFHAVSTPVTLNTMIHTCAEIAGTNIDLVRTADGPGPLIRTDWPSQQRSPTRARAAGMPTTPLPTTVSDVHAWLRTST